jgi:hypothetical protein
LYPSLPKAIYCYNVLGVIIFGSVRFLSKKSNQTKFFLKKNETGSNQPVSVRFGFLDKNRFKPVWLGFFRFGSVWVRFGSVRFFRF